MLWNVKIVLILLYGIELLNRYSKDKDNMEIKNVWEKITTKTIRVFNLFNFLFNRNQSTEI